MWINSSGETTGESCHAALLCSSFAQTFGRLRLFAILLRHKRKDTYIEELIEEEVIFFIFWRFYKK